MGKKSFRNSPDTLDTLFQPPTEGHPLAPGGPLGPAAPIEEVQTEPQVQEVEAAEAQTPTPAPATEVHAVGQDHEAAAAKGQTKEKRKPDELKRGRRVNVLMEEDTYRKAQELARQDARTLSGYIHSLIMADIRAKEGR